MRVMVNTDAMEELYEMVGFIPASKYARLVPEDGEIGACKDMRFFEGPRQTEFVTTEEFAQLMGLPGFNRISDIQGELYGSTYISLVPPP